MLPLVDTGDNVCKGAGALLDDSNDAESYARVAVVLPLDVEEALLFFSIFFRLLLVAVTSVDVRLRFDSP